MFFLIYYLLALSYFNQENFKVGFDYINKAIILNSTDYKMYWLKAKFYIKLNNINLAIQNFDKAIKLNSQDKDLLMEKIDVLEKEGKAFATEILELRPKNEWYDYEAKYPKGMTEFILPAELSAETTAKVKEIAIKAFKICNCSGVSRIDFLIVNDIPYILEINTNPGMTDTSDLPAQAAVCGIEYDNLVLMILNSAGLNK